MGMACSFEKKNTTVQPSKQQDLKLAYRGGADISCRFLLLHFSSKLIDFFKARSQT
jgi:hypothetical protein